MVDFNSAGATNYRSAELPESSLMPPTPGGGYGMGAADQLRTPFAGNVRAMAPPLPPQAAMAMSQFGGFGGAQNMYGGGFGAGYGGMGYGGGYGAGYGGYGGGYGGYGGGFGGGYRYGGMNPMDPEARFIQLAEASSRPAFASIESLVSAVGNIAQMLDSTFFALTSSFRAILGVAANFGRLRGVFTQFWQTFAIFRSLRWLYKKMLYWLHISDLDPSSEAFRRAYADAVNKQGDAPGVPRKGQSPWPVVAFLGFIFTAPYLIMKLLNTVTNTAQEEARDPARWQHPIETVAIYDFEARNATELSMHAGQRIHVAPKEIQNTLGLINTGWGLATLDGKTSGIIPFNYVKSAKEMREEQLQHMQQQQQCHEQESAAPKAKEFNAKKSDAAAALSTAASPPAAAATTTKPSPHASRLSASAFPAPPTSRSSSSSNKTSNESKKTDKSSNSSSTVSNNLTSNIVDGIKSKADSGEKKRFI